MKWKKYLKQREVLLYSRNSWTLSIFTIKMLLWFLCVCLCFLSMRNIDLLSLCLRVMGVVTTAAGHWDSVADDVAGGCSAHASGVRGDVGSAEGNSWRGLTLWDVFFIRKQRFCSCLQSCLFIFFFPKRFNWVYWGEWWVVCGFRLFKVDLSDLDLSQAFAAVV